MVQLRIKSIILLTVPLVLCWLMVPTKVSAGTATISIGQQVTGEIGPGDRRLPSGQIYDEYFFSGLSGDKLIISLSSLEVDTALWLLDANRNVKVMNDDSGEGTDSIISNFVLPADGKYYIWATTHSKGEMGAYSLSLNLTPTTGNPAPILLGETLSGNLDVSDTQLDCGQYIDAYTFYADPNQSIKINMNSSDLDAYLWLLDSQGRVITVGNDGQDTTDSQIIFIPKVMDDYTIWASSNNAGETGAYNLTLETSAVLGQTIPLDSGDALIDTLVPNSAQLNTGQFVNVHNFNGISGQSATISLTSADFDGYLRLFDNTGELIKNTDNDSISNLILPASGTYLVWASSVFAGNVGEYSLSLNLSLADSGSITGLVTDYCSGDGINQATVSTTPIVYFTETDTAGNYALSNLAPGTYSVGASAAGYDSALAEGVTVATGGTAIVDFILNNGSIKYTYYRDSDGDGYGDPGNTLEACVLVSGYVEDGTDCDDTAPLVNPGVIEFKKKMCRDGIDNDCDGLIDADDPGCGGGSTEICDNGIDDDGDGRIDCADRDCRRNPACRSGAEICDNGIDDDGDGRIDCADRDCRRNPVCKEDSDEICDNGIDDDGDGRIDCADRDCRRNPACRR